MNIGIDQIHFYCPHYTIDIKTISAARDYHSTTLADDIGQEKMAVPPPDEDVVSMAANAGLPIIEKIGTDSIDMLIFATESGVDQSKSAGIYVHQLLNLSKQCRVFEIKQACYSATAALQLALPYIAQSPEKKVLILASDIARYDLKSNEELTQGAAAIAMLISANPRIIAFQGETGYYTEDVMDFWRPNICSEALVNSALSIRMYIKSLLQTWTHYQSLSQSSFDQHFRFCYHLPFSNMAYRAHRHLRKHLHLPSSKEEIRVQIGDSLCYNRIIGNSYTASLYIVFASLLDNSSGDLSHEKIAFFSYGSGCMAEFFSGIMMPTYHKELYTERHQQNLENRKLLSLEDYERFHHEFSYTSSDQIFPEHKTGRFRLAMIKKQKRIYARLT